MWVKRSVSLMLWVYWFTVNHLLWITLNVKNGNQWSNSNVIYSVICEKRPRTINAFFLVRIKLGFLLHVAHFFFNLLVNRSMLDFVLDSVKRSRRSRRHSNRERGTLLTGRSVNPTLINRTSLRASKRLLQQSTTMISVNRVYWSEAMRHLTKRCVTKRSEAVSKTKK